MEHGPFSSMIYPFKIFGNRDFPRRTVKLPEAKIQGKNNVWKTGSLSNLPQPQNPEKYREQNHKSSGKISQTNHWTTRSFFFTSPFGLQDNHMVRLFREAGAIIVGTTAMTEFGVTPLGCRGSTMGSSHKGKTKMVSGSSETWIFLENSPHWLLNIVDIDDFSSHKMH